MNGGDEGKVGFFEGWEEGREREGERGEGRLRWFSEHKWLWLWLCAVSVGTSTSFKGVFFFFFGGEIGF